MEVCMMEINMCTMEAMAQCEEVRAIKYSISKQYTQIPMQHSMVFDRFFKNWFFLRFINLALFKTCFMYQ